jgi:hypothetical protein
LQGLQEMQGLQILFFPTTASENLHPNIRDHLLSPGIFPPLQINHLWGCRCL